MGTVSKLSQILTIYSALQILVFLRERRGLTVSGSSSVSGTVGKRMVQPGYCVGQVLEKAGRYSSFGVRSKLECVARCRENTKCKSITYDGRNRMCHLGDAKAEEDCSNMEAAAHATMVFYQEMVCGEGYVLGPLGLCVCAKGFTGVPCKRYFHDCTDVHNYSDDWKGTTGVYTVTPLTATAPFKVFCKKIYKVRTYIMDRRKTLVNFTRPWLDYRNGFGEVRAGSDYWLGLEKIYALTADRNQELRVNIKKYQKANKAIIVSYYNFRLTDEASGYRMYFNASGHNDTDCLKPLLGARFSTFDRDRDRASDVDCAEKYKGGFWFQGSDCAECNPTGVLYQNNDRNYKEGEVFWKSALGNEPVWKIAMYLLPMED